MKVGRHGAFIALIANTGGTASAGVVEVRDALPFGLTATSIFTSASEEECEGIGSREVVCRLPESVASGGFVAVEVGFEESAALTPGVLLHNLVTASGGGGSSASGEAAIRVQPEGETGAGAGGIANFSVRTTGPAGEPVSQAGGHPALLTTSVFFNTQYVEGIQSPRYAVEEVKDLAFYLPIGMLGDPAIAEQCPMSRVSLLAELEGCPPGSRLGSVMPLILGIKAARERGVYNLVPEKGYAAEFAFSTNNFTFVAYANVVHRDGTYMVRVSIPGVSAGAALTGLVSTFYGDIQEHFSRSEQPITYDRGAFLTNPTNCDEPAPEREASVAANTWQHPDPSLPLTASSMVFPSLTGCGSLSFSAHLGVAPETTRADEPSGLDVNLEIPQAPNDPSGLGTPPAKDETVALPVGMTVSPSSANGLQACAATGPEGIDIEGPESEEIAEDGLPRPAHGHCPLASQIATVRATTPLLHEQLTGRIFLAEPGCGGEGQPACTIKDAEDGNLVGLYLELEGPNSGIVVKLKGHTTLKAGSGRVTAGFEEIPQFPIGDVVVSTKAGEHAALENPQACGPSTSTATLIPWSPEIAAAEPSNAFTVDWNGHGQACPAVAPFEPAFEAGTTSPAAASTSPFELALRREDREQNIDTLATTLPAGLLAELPKVAKCPEPQASEDSLTACPAASQIGTTRVAVGAGGDPYYETGKVFFTGPYGGAPFGLSVVVPAVAGPFDLGDVHVRAKLFVDPHTTQVTAVSDPLPQELDGIPLRIRVLDVNLTNNEFVLNPTSCAKASIAGTVTSTTGAVANVSSPFAAMGCNRLPFKPAFEMSTEAKATKENGTGVHIKIAYPARGEANIAKLVIGFPKQLPVRLETLQKACPAATFEANPAACPAASNVGTATVHTPILAQPPTGPIYLVSYGSAKFPDAVVVLQGEGVTIDVDGQSFVSKSAALTATFAAIPDAPFTTFEATLPRGHFSQFTSVRTVGRAQGSQCGENPIAPITVTAHNGSSFTENLNMQIVGCRPSLAIQHAAAGAYALTVTVKTTVSGRLRVSGHDLNTLVERNVSPGTHRLTVSYTPAGIAAAHAHRRIMLTAALVAGRQRASRHKKIAL
jgi:hypothetical protein